MSACDSIDGRVASGRDGCYRRANSPGEKASASNGRFAVCWFVYRFERYRVPAFYKFDGVGWADTGACLALGAVSAPCGEIWLDGIKGAYRDAFVAVDAG